jgi:LuxR family maltose regulon positive regulatory protein
MEQYNTNILLRTKLQIPDLPSDYIYRPYLIEYLNEDIKRPLTLVSAGAGYGKSTLISSWTNTLPYKNCWLSIDENDNDIRTFLSYFIAAIQTQIPGFGKNIYRNIFSPNIHSLEILTNNLINDLSSLEDDVILILDDFQSITNFKITNLISNILKYPPDRFHLVIISRADPPLPLSKLRAANKMKDIRTSHLRLNTEETKLFSQNNFEIEDIDSIISIVNDRFEGWVTGIRLLKIHLSYKDYNVNDFKQLIKNSRFSDTYFIDELIKHIDVETLNFLLQTSILQKINSNLSDYVLSAKDKTFNSKQIIKELLNKNLFLINLDNNDKWFRYHHLFQNALQEELKRTYDGEQITNIHKKAIEWYSNNQLYEDAFHHATQTNDINIIVEFVQTNIDIPLNKNRWFVLEKWLKHIPENIINDNPILLIAQIWIMHHKGVLWVIPKLITKVEKIRDNNIELFEEIKPQLVFFKAMINFWNANLNESLEQFDYVRKNITSDKLGTKSLSSIYYANASQMTGKGEEVYKEIQLEISRNNLHPDYKIILLASLVYIKLLNGDLYAAERITNRIRKISSATNNDFYVAWYEFFLGYISFQQYRQEQALSHFKNALEGVYLLNTHAPIDAFAGILLTLGNTNKKKEFEQIYNQLTSFVYEWNSPAYNTIAHSLKARLAIADNNLQKASENIKKADMIFDSGILVFNIEVPRITFCKLLLAKNSYKKTHEAINKLTEILDFVFKINNIPQSIEVLVLLSVAYYKNNDLQLAIDSLTQAIKLAEKGHIIHPFIEQAENIIPLLLKIKSNDDNINDFISLLNNIISNNNNNIKKEASFIESLSNRELDVILLLAQRFSNKEIAEKLFISPTTVKKHTINIYQKLDVNKRLEAVARAKEIGIIN